MKRLVCEMCGGTDLIKQDGVFVCQSCGCKYSVEEARKMMVEVEGTIDVSGSTVKVDTSKRLENLYILARRARDDDNIQDAAKYYYEIRLEDPNSWEAAFYGVYFSALDCKIGQIGYAASSVANSLNTIASLIVEHVPQEEQKQAYTEMLTRAQFAGKVLYNGAKSAYEDVDYGNANSDFIDRATQCFVLMMGAGKVAEDFFSDYELAKEIYIDSAKTLRSSHVTGTLAILCDDAINKLRPKLKEKQQDEEKKSLEADETPKNEGKRLSVQNVLAAGGEYTVGICADGTVVSVGDNSCGQQYVFDWHDIVAISANGAHVLGLHSNGTVVAAGDNSTGRCNVENWTNIASVSAGWNHTVGMRMDGSVIAVGSNDCGQCDVTDWCDIKAIAAGGGHTVGLRANGTVVSAGSNHYGERNVQDWADIVGIAVGFYHTVGLRADGTVVATGGNAAGQCDVSDWQNVVAIAAGEWHTVGLRSDGTVVAAGDDKEGLCKVSGWNNIMAIDAGTWHTVGLHSDGTVVAVGANDMGQCDVSYWDLCVSEEMLKQLNERKTAILKAKPASLKRERTGLLDEQTKLQAELPTLKGLFSGGRRKEVEARLAQIPTRIAEIDSELAKIEKELAALG